MQQLGLTATGERAEYRESLYTGRALPTGWFVLFIDKCDHEFVQPKTLSSISTIGDVVACSIEEHVMCSKAELWREGGVFWCVEHDAQKGMSHISVSGTQPDGYSAIEAEFTEKQRQAGGDNSGVDYFFEIPLQLARSIVGFKHDEAGDESTFVVFRRSAFEEAVPAKAETKAWWKFW